MSRKKRSTETGSEAEISPRKPAITGPEVALSIPTQQGTSVDLSYWDLWFALSAWHNFEGDLDRLAIGIKEGRGSMIDRDSIERKRSHLRDLKRRLEAASITPAQIVKAAGALARTEKRRALERVKGSCDRPIAWSEPMRNTPRNRRYPMALHGHWNRFPVSPQPYYETIRSHYNPKAFYSESMSFKIARTLDRYADKASKLLAVGNAAQAQALLRGWMTVIIELMEQADDSCGCIAMSFDDGFRAYLTIPLDETGIDDDVFLHDLLDFLIWEDYGLTDHGIEGFFKGLTDGQADFCIDHMRHEVAALRDDDLDYQSEQALTFLGQVIAEQKRFDQFEALAGEMGAREWRRIVTLVDVAMKNRKKPLALKVLEAAMTNGHHLDLLTRKYEQLKQGRWNADPRK